MMILVYDLVICFSLRSHNLFCVVYDIVFSIINDMLKITRVHHQDTVLITQAITS